MRFDLRIVSTFLELRIIKVVLITTIISESTIFTIILVANKGSERLMCHLADEVEYTESMTI